MLENINCTKIMMEIMTKILVWCDIASGYKSGKNLTSILLQVYSLCFFNSPHFSFEILGDDDRILTIMLNLMHTHKQLYAMRRMMLGLGSMISLDFLPEVLKTRLPPIGEDICHLILECYKVRKMTLNKRH
jgi:hypothetical protein